MFIFDLSNTKFKKLNMKFKTSPPPASLMPILTALFFIFSFNNISAQFLPNGGDLYHTRGDVGIGIENPLKTLHLYNHIQTPILDDQIKSTLRLQNYYTYELQGKSITPPNPTVVSNSVWDIENDKTYLKFNHGISELTETKFTFSNIGTLTATKFVGDGSGLTDIKIITPLILDGDMDPWTNSGWRARLQTPLGTAWTTTDKVSGQDYYLGLGMTSGGWYFITRRDDLTKRYVCHISEEGFISATKVKVEQRNWSDFVFEPNYGLTPLKELETYINQNKHLPQIPSEQDIIEEGLDLGEMQKLQMQKIEELTLYMIQLNKENKKLQERMLKLENK